jgi:pyruvate ferredoxin oxidoreductase beta subunit
MAPCPPGWRFGMERTVEMGTLAVETGAWALYEFENEKMTFNGKSKLILEGKIKRKPIEDFIKYQGRFRHLFIPKKDVERIKTIEEHIDQKWERYRACYL